MHVVHAPSLSQLESRRNLCEHLREHLHCLRRLHHHSQVDRWAQDTCGFR